MIRMSGALGRSRKRFDKVREQTEIRERRFDKVREIRFKSRFFSCLDSDSDRKDFLDFFGFLDFRGRSFAKMGGEGPIWGRIGRVIDWEHF